MRTCMKDPSRMKRVAIIGTGLAGLNVAHLLSETAELRQRFEVHLFEKGEKLGLDGSSITVAGARIDVPLRSFNAGYYPNLMKLYKKLKIPVKKNNFTFSFSTASQPRHPLLIYNGQNGLRGFSLPWQQSNGSTSSPFDYFFNYFHLSISMITSYFALLLFALYHHYICDHLTDPKHPLSSQPLKSWLDENHRFFSPIFIDTILFSIFSAMTTSSINTVEEMPTSELLLYVAATFLRNHYTTLGGVQKVQDQLILNIPKSHIHTGVTIKNIRRGINIQKSMMKEDDYDYDDDNNNDNDDEMEIIDLLGVDQNNQDVLFDGFHHVVFATPANLSASLLETYKTTISSKGKQFSQRLDKIQGLRDELNLVRYETSTVINHTDETLLPENRNNWRDLNTISPLTGKLEAANKLSNTNGTVNHHHQRHQHTMATHVSLQLGNGQYIFQTTNPVLIMPRSSTILSTSTFQRAMTQSKSKQHRLFKWVKKGSGEMNFGSGRWRLQLGSLQGRQGEKSDIDRLPGLWFCGSYAQGIPLLEGCVTSSSLVVDRMIQQG